MEGADQERWAGEQEVQVIELQRARDFARDRQCHRSAQNRLIH